MLLLFFLNEFCHCSTFIPFLDVFERSYTARQEERQRASLKVTGNSFKSNLSTPKQGRKRLLSLSKGKKTSKEISGVRSDAKQNKKNTQVTRPYHATDLRIFI